MHQNIWPSNIPTIAYNNRGLHHLTHKSNRWAWINCIQLRASHFHLELVYSLGTCMCVFLVDGWPVSGYLVLHMVVDERQWEIPKTLKITLANISSSWVWDTQNLFNINTSKYSLKLRMGISMVMRVLPIVTWDAVIPYHLIRKKSRALTALLDKNCKENSNKYLFCFVWIKPIIWRSLYCVAGIR